MDKKEDPNLKKKKKKKKKKTYGAPVVKKGANYYVKSSDKIHNWENWSDEKEISFKSPRDDCTLYFSKCNKTNITITDKSTRIVLIKCSGCTLNTDGVIINKIELNACQDTNIKVGENAPIIHVSKCSNTNVTMSRFAAMGKDDNNKCDLLTEESVGTSVAVDGQTFNSLYQVCSTFNKDDNSFTDSVPKDSKPVTKLDGVPKDSEANFQKKQDGLLYLLNWDNSKDLVVPEEKLDHLYFGNCKNVVGEYKGEAPIITISGCEKFGLQVKEEVKQVNVIDCKSLRLGLDKVCGGINISGSSGTMIYLSEAAAGKGGEPLTVYSDTSNLTNIAVNGGTEDEPTNKEHGVQEQIHSKFNGHKEEDKREWVHVIEKK